MYSKLHIFKKACTAKIFALSWIKTCSTSKGWNNCTSPGQGSVAAKLANKKWFYGDKRQIFKTFLPPTSSWRASESKTLGDVIINQ